MFMFGWGADECSVVECFVFGWGADECGVVEYKTDPLSYSLPGAPSSSAPWWAESPVPGVVRPYLSVHRVSFRLLPLTAWPASTQSPHCSGKASGSVEAGRAWRVIPEVITETDGLHKCTCYIPKEHEGIELWGQSSALPSGPR